MIVTEVLFMHQRTLLAWARHGLARVPQPGLSQPTSQGVGRSPLQEHQSAASLLASFLYCSIAAVLQQASSSEVMWVSAVGRGVVLNSWTTQALMPGEVRERWAQNALGTWREGVASFVWETRRALLKSEGRLEKEMMVFQGSEGLNPNI